MTEPRTEAGRDLLAHSVQYNPLDADRTVTGAKIAEVEAEARAVALGVEALAEAYNAYSWPVLPKGVDRPHDLAEFVAAALGRRS